MTPVTRYWLNPTVDSASFSARLIRKVRALNYSVVVHCQTAECQKQMIAALNRLNLEPQLQVQAGQIAVCVDAMEALAETSNSIMLKLAQNSLLLNLSAQPLAAFSRFERYAEVRPDTCQMSHDNHHWYTDRGYPIQEHRIHQLTGD